MSRRLRIVTAAAVCCCVILTALTLRAQEAPEPGAAESERFGTSMRLVLPIDARSIDRVKRFVRRTMSELDAQAERPDARPVLLFEFDVPEGAEEYGRGSEFAQAYGVADYLSGPELSGATTVAFVPETIQGHAVLVALACDELIMAPDAELGPAGVDDPTIDETRLSAYRTIARRRRTMPAPVALGLLDPRLEVLRVETDAGREYVLRSELDKLERDRSIESTEVLFPAGEAGRLIGREARSLGLVSYLADNRRAAADALGLPVRALLPDPAAGGEWRAARFELRGPLKPDDVLRVQRMMQERIQQDDINFVLLWIDSPGGAPEECAALATFLADLDPSKVRTVAYIPNQARGDAALAALGCDQIMLLAGATFGGSGAAALSEREVTTISRTIRESLAPIKNRSWSLPAAIIDEDLTVFECQRLNLTEYFSEEELQEQPNPDGWEKGRQVTRPGEAFRAVGQEAVDFHLATRVVDSFADVKRHFGLENDPALIEPGWADELIDLLASPGATVLLLMIGGFAIYFELHSPGVGVGAFVAAVCFTLFFWASYLGGTAGWLEGLLFLLGLVCLLLELFVLPGFGIFGLGGGALVLASVILATQTLVLPHNRYQLEQFQQSVLTIAIASMTTWAMAIVKTDWIPRTTMLDGVVLAPPGSGPDDATPGAPSTGDLPHASGAELVIGQRGTTATQLTPSGKAQFGTRWADVLTDGELVDRDTEIEVVEIHANRIIVRPV